MSSNILVDAAVMREVGEFLMKMCIQRVLMIQINSYTFYDDGKIKRGMVDR